MKKFFLAAVIFSITVISIAAQTKNQTKPASAASADVLAEAKRAIDKGNAQWCEAWEKGDPSMVAELFTEDGKILSSSGAVIKGHKQILERQKAVMQALGKGVKVTATTTKVWLDGDTAYESGKYSYTYQENGKTTVDTGKYVTMWKRQKNGSWKLFMDMAVPEN
jgi:uncharacterized protein (TIGR02246 family)